MPEAIRGSLDMDVPGRPKGSKTVTFLRYLLSILNIVFLIVGCVLIAFGTYIYNYWKDYTDFLGGTKFVCCGILIIVLGCLISITSFLGCCGSCEKSKCMMGTFSVFTVMLILFEIVALITFGVTVFANRDKIERRTVMEMKDGLYNHTPEDIEYQVVYRNLDFLQRSYKCCGI